MTRTSCPEYVAWVNMKFRCYNPNHKYAKSYLGKGITIYREWLNSFEAFYDYIGSRPTARHSLDRIDNDGNYEPGNVRWATAREQMNNRSVLRNHYGHPGLRKHITKDGVTRWSATICRKRLGTFATKGEAIAVMKIAEREYDINLTQVRSRLKKRTIR